MQTSPRRGRAPLRTGATPSYCNAPGEAHLTDEDDGSATTTTRRDCLLGSAALLVAAASAPAVAAPVAAVAETAAVSGGCTPFRRVYLQK